MSGNAQLAVALHGLTVLTYLGGRVSSSKIAKSINTNPVVVRRVFGKLAESGIVCSSTGKNGGFALAREAGEIRVSEVFKALETRTFTVHSNDRNQACMVSCGIKPALNGLFAEADQVLFQEFEKTSLADFATRVSKLADEEHRAVMTRD